MPKKGEFQKYCKRGHEFLPGSFRQTKDKRVCRPCQRILRDTDKRRAWKRAWHKAHPEYARKKGLKQYNLTLEQYEELFNAQGRRCAACGTDKSFSRRTSTFPVDHDHETNEVRGILCMNCNRALGLLKDSIPVLEGMLAYLKKYEKEAPTGI